MTNDFWFSTGRFSRSSISRLWTTAILVFCPPYQPTVLNCLQCPHLQPLRGPATGLDLRRISFFYVVDQLRDALKIEAERSVDQDNGIRMHPSAANDDCRRYHCLAEGLANTVGLVSIGSYQLRRKGDLSRHELHQPGGYLPKALQKSLVAYTLRNGGGLDSDVRTLRLRDP